MKYKIGFLLLIVGLYAVGVYISGWTFEKGLSAVFVYIFGVLSAFIGWNLGALHVINKKIENLYR